ncbi:M28 family peptidase [Chelatococcus asaccharovorans]|uniref:Peptidase M28-like protein n=1 Tax=Chelatococcus asaccharovorans TaxID=28210 RepID=A0A2V3UDP0_9HYPH|nr:M28 family peptidase [Chelatococcus asaccharovorans]MBS7707180.1 M28 family peptidase [Chelatococcus asaccharovorans]PXW63362.1 peptidase M28-like protein [Chelatococcus asaccharovorans]
MSAPSLKAVTEAVDGPLMMRHMRLFDRYTKVAGTPTELESLRYCEGEMKSYGFTTEIILHDAYISIPVRGEVILDGRALRAITHSFSRPSPAAGLTAEVVDLGSGTAADFARQDVTGKLVLIDGIANPAAALRASQAGAAGQIHVSPHEHLHEMCVSPVWGSPTHETVDRLPKTVIVQIPFDEGQALRRRRQEDPSLQVTVHAEVDTGWRKTPILVADLMTGPEPQEQPYIFYTGHHDTWYYGVMDNGGANATMMEVSRIAALHRSAWRRGLRVVFWSGHSQGRYSSSSWYSDKNWEDIDARALVHVNVDSTGGLGNTVVGDTSCAAELRPLAAEAVMAYSGQTFNNRRQSRAGDQSFWGIGVPGIFQNMSEQPASPDAETNASASVFGGGNRVGHGTGWWWHNPADTLDKIDEAILVRDTKIYMHAVWRLLTDRILPLDYAEHARYLAATLKELQDAAGSRFDLSLLMARAARLEALASQLNALSQTADEGSAETINATLKAVARALVPVDYTEKDRFTQDPALAVGAYPGLQPIRQFATLDPDSDAAKFLHVGMMRAHNRTATALAEAIRAIEACLHTLGATAR